MSDDERAAAKYEIRIVPAREEGKSLLSNLVQWVLMLFGQASAGSYQPVQDIEIVDRLSGVVAYRDGGELANSITLATQTFRADLDAMTVEEFEEKWSPLRVSEL